MNKKDINKVSATLSIPRNIVIVTHKNPDGDAIGSSLALYNYLQIKGHHVTVITPNDYPDFLKWLNGNNKVINFETKAKKAKEIISKANVVFCLDFNSLKRIDELGEVIGISDAIKIIIDHHLEPEDFADVTISDTFASSTAQMVYEFIVAMGDKDIINKAIADAIYLGIMTDTGSFRFSSVTALTHHVIAHLIEAGADNSMVHEKVYDTNTESRLKLLGYCLSEKLKVFEEFHTALITLTKDELQRFNYKKGDTEGFVNYPLSIEGIKMTAFFTEGEEYIRISFRSKGDFSVNELSKNHFNGGGHGNAAGGMSELTMDETVLKFISLLPQYRNALQS
ncbi:MAG: bifunctional oligoribonuclease/PAP phosphatase NrnA [Bacteroidetes bacterium]|nr:bifunctional oligoribonuclease/PAP phosphatase NrnA [Bacteroidota bacterium]HET6244938.1 bifunctional oligoribonuclease/PAP phosphatase NrnA [Bacteroidia bacterium]